MAVRSSEDSRTVGPVLLDPGRSCGPQIPLDSFHRAEITALIVTDSKAYEASTAVDLAPQLPWTW